MSQYILLFEGIFSSIQYCQHLSALFFCIFFSQLNSRSLSSSSHCHSTEGSVSKNRIVFMPSKVSQTAIHYVEFWCVLVLNIRTWLILVLDLISPHRSDKTPAAQCFLKLISSNLWKMKMVGRTNRKRSNITRLYLNPNSS